MRRAVFAILGTAAATTLLVGIKAQADSAPSDPVALEDPAPQQSGPATTPSPGAKGSTKPTGAPPANAGGAPKKITGKTVNTPYGAVTVTITVDGAKKITDVTAKLPDTGESQGAGPKLKAQVLQKQSADVDTVSGATYTSDAYRNSLQSALDKR
jgi:uncharacterized protein with FMN-binding domain